MVRSLGAVPIPTAAKTDSTATASEQEPAVLAMGAPVRVSLPGSVRAVVTALGPVELTPQPGRKDTVGVITVKLVAETGSLTATAAEFSSRDETGRAVTLAPQGPSAATSSANRPASIVIRGTYTSGAAQLTWRHDGHVVAVWDFNIELD